MSYTKKNMNKVIFPAVAAAMAGMMSEGVASTQYSTLTPEGTMTAKTALAAATTQQQYDFEVGTVVEFDATAVAAANYKYLYQVTDSQGAGGEVIFYSHGADPYGSSVASATYSTSAYVNIAPANTDTANIDLFLVCDGAVGQSNSCIGLDPSKWRSVNVWARSQYVGYLAGLMFDTGNSNTALTSANYNVRMPYRWTLPKSVSYANQGAYGISAVLLTAGFKAVDPNASVYDSVTQKVIPIAHSSYDPTVYKTVPVSAGTVQLKSAEFYDLLDELVGGKFPELTKLKVATPSAIATYLQSLMTKY